MAEITIVARVNGYQRNGRELEPRQAMAQFTTELYWEPLLIGDKITASLPTDLVRIEIATLAGTWIYIPDGRQYPRWWELWRR